jgi:hypothetical protein
MNRDGPIEESMTSTMTPKEEHHFYANPDNQKFHGPARRRKSKLTDPTHRPNTPDRLTSANPAT